MSEDNKFDIKTNPNLVIALGVYIRSKRINKKIGLREMAEMLKISPAYLSNLESGKHNMTNPLLLKNIAKILEIDHLTLYKIIGYTDKDKDELKNEIMMEIVDEISNKELVDIIKSVMEMTQEQIILVKQYIKLIKKT